MDAYGSDIVRLFVLSRVGASEDLVWDESGIQGMQRWIQRLDELLETYVSIKAVERSEMKQTEHHALRLLTKDTLLKVNLALNETQGLHNAISALMILSKSLQDGGAEYCHDLAWRKSFETLTVLCMTFAPEWATRAISRMGMRSPAWPSLEDLSLPVGEEQSIPFKVIVRHFAYSFPMDYVNDSISNNRLTTRPTGPLI